MNGSAQESVNRPQQSRTPRPSEIKESLIKQGSKAERRAAFAVALKHGCSIAECSRTAGVTPNTGRQWARQIRATWSLEREHAQIASKTETAEILTAIARDPEAPAPYRVNAVATLNKQLGYDAPTRSEITARVVPDSVLSWALAEVIDVEPISQAPALPDNATPTKALGE